ncbi:hypothetical protein VMCG_05739 [Cytospora schulzeri]|uniref:Uncharacterized protein n=1 Tax=Cytospora schulzeri TaxID=448051 RepID=A0A423WHW0_9PEZI|nr:hypothetical protein VMCG_05739 [Valsa malicola]
MPATLSSTTVFCNVTISCTAKITSLQDRLEDAQRLSYILGALNKAQLKDYDVEARTMRHPGGFAVSEEPRGIQVSRANASTVAYSGMANDYREDIIGGEIYHVHKSDTSILLETGIFRGLPNQRELAAKCVRDMDGSVADGDFVLGDIGIDITDLKSSAGYRGQPSSARKPC